MRQLAYLVLAALFVALSGNTTNAQKKTDPKEIVAQKDYRGASLVHSTNLQVVLENAIKEVLASSKDHQFKPDEIAATIIDLRDAAKLQTASYRGEERIYPASVVKMFYMAALERQLEDRKVTDTTELQRGLRDMIVDSSNEATQYILDVLTNTSSGTELPQKEFDTWQSKRNNVNRWLSSMGYKNVNANQKTFCEDAYGIEQQSRAYKGQNRNMLTTAATARLLAEIVLGRLNTAERTQRMMDLMKRDWSAPSNDADNQAVGFVGKALIDKRMTGAKLWSKAGWTSKSRHDAAYLETPDGLRFVLVIFTENHANDRDVIPSVAWQIIEKLKG